MSHRAAVQEARLAVLAAALALFACAGVHPPRPVPLLREARAVLVPWPRPPASPAGWEPYAVRHRDTLGRIAACRGISVQELARANGVADPDRLAVGQRLRVPPVDRCPRATLDEARREPADAAPLAEAAPAPQAAEASLRRARGLLDAARWQYDAARFEEALAGAEAAAAELAPHGGRAEVDPLRARCLLVAGMAATALDERPRALELFRAAFALDPSLSLPRDETSPRILDLVDEVTPPGRQAER